MSASLFQPRFDAWLDDLLEDLPNEEIVAFSFNLSEPWSIEVVGCGSYDEDDEDWATDEIFRSGTDPLELPESEAGSDWESVLGYSKSLLLAYLHRPGPGSALLKKSTAIAVGFVDGELHKVWP